MKGSERKRDFPTLFLPHFPHSPAHKPRKKAVEPFSTRVTDSVEQIDRGVREVAGRREEGGGGGGVYIGIIYRSRAFIGDSRIDVKSRQRFAAAVRQSGRLSLRPLNFRCTRAVTSPGFYSLFPPLLAPLDARVYRRFDEFSNFPTKFGQIRPNERNVGRPKFMRGINSLRCALRRGLRAHLRTYVDQEVRTGA